jgi:hypothetical protein
MRACFPSIRRTALRFAVLSSLTFVAAFLTGCIERATVPPVRQGVDPASRQRIYEDYKLAYDKTFFTENWARKDGEHNLAELEDVVGAYQETRELRGRIQSRRLAIGTVSGVGAGIVGFTLGWNLTADQQTKMSTSTQTALYVTGGALILTSIVIQAAWRDPAEDLADVYNHAHAADLGLAPP